MISVLQMIVSFSYVMSLPWLGRRLTMRGTRRFAVEVYCPDASYPHPISLRGIEETVKEYPPLIYHINSERTFSSLRALIKHETNLSDSYINELCEYGAVYLSTVHEEKPAEKQKRSSKMINHMSNPRSSSSSSSDYPKQTAKVQRIHSLDMPVEKGTYCRVHGNPRRSLGILSLYVSNIPSI